MNLTIESQILGDTTVAELEVEVEAVPARDVSSLEVDQWKNGIPVRRYPFMSHIRAIFGMPPYRLQGPPTLTNSYQANSKNIAVDPFIPRYKKKAMAILRATAD